MGLIAFLLRSATSSSDSRTPTTQAPSEISASDKISDFFALSVYSIDFSLGQNLINHPSDISNVQLIVGIEIGIDVIERLDLLLGEQILEQSGHVGDIDLAVAGDIASLTGKGVRVEVRDATS